MLDFFSFTVWVASALIRNLEVQLFLFSDPYLLEAWPNLLPFSCSGGGQIQMAINKSCWFPDVSSDFESLPGDSVETPAAASNDGLTGILHSDAP